jgi:hypothetical protein
MTTFCSSSISRHDGARRIPMSAIKLLLVALALSLGLSAIWSPTPLVGSRCPAGELCVIVDDGSPFSIWDSPDPMVGSECPPGTLCRTR